jgi:hypothetical protein
LPGDWALSLRDFLMFRHRRDSQVMQNAVRFMIGLDAFLRLNLMEGLSPICYPVADADTTAPSGRAWGV